MSAPRALGFLGRSSERELLDRLPANVHAGQGAVLVMPSAAFVPA